MYEGEGVLIKPNGRRYTGKFSGGMQHGNGKYVIPNEGTYIG